LRKKRKKDFNSKTRFSLVFDDLWVPLPASRAGWNLGEQQASMKSSMLEIQSKKLIRIPDGSICD
jgi:hypothetical protein